MLEIRRGSTESEPQKPRRQGSRRMADGLQHRGTTEGYEKETIG